MQNKFFIESYIRWSGIDSNGHIHADLFYGSKKQLNRYAKQKNILLTHTKLEFCLKKNEAHSQFIYTFTKDMGAILSTGIDLIDALKMLSYRHTDAHIKTVITALITQLHSGQTFSHALSCFPKLFSLSYITLIEAGEMTHQLPLIFTQLAKQQEFSSNLKNKIKKALIYPSCVLLFSLFITIGLIAFAIPQFQTIFTNFNAKLPALTQTVFILANTLLHNKFWILTLLTFIPLTTYLLYKKSRHIKSYLQALLIHTPWIGRLYRNKQIANWSYIMSLSIQSRLVLPQCLELANATLTHLKTRKACSELTSLLNAGNTLYEALSTVCLFLPAELYLIRMGESSHTLHQSFERLSSQAFDAIAQSLGSLSKWLEPVIMLVLAVIAGGLIVSMYLPIFKIGAIL